MKKRIIQIILCLLFALISWYFILPPLNITSPLFWSYIFEVMVVCVVIFTVGETLDFRHRINFSKFKWIPIVAGCAIVCFALITVINIVYSPLFMADKYANRIIVDETGNFIEDVAPVDFNKIPLLDKESSEKLGDRKMGQATEWVSQYYVSEEYTQINYNDSIVRVTPIEYADIIKYFTNRKEGIKGYITVNSVDGSSELVTMDKGMKYMPSAYFFENLNRKLRINYPTAIFDEPNFEIDNEGNPYWIVPTIKYSGVGLKKEINGVIIFDAITGNSKKYNLKDVPTWVDHVYSADLIIEQLDNWGEYKEGFWNSIFGQKNVVNTTDGYNYLVMDDDVYLYTGITSVSTDESNLGFVLVNMRTKETKYYSAPGAEEYSAMASAEGLVQEKKYTASFPLLINLNNKPTYLLSLKDNAGLVKMYAFVDVADYQKVVVNDASLGIDAAAKKYLGESTSEYDANNLKEKTITIKEVTNAVIDGNTYYYFTDTEGNLYSASIKVDKNILPFMKSGQKYKVTYSESEVNILASIEK
ncbi:MAG: CvpA family protein [Bacilli bacterium]|nr:CvpA family protein [Bacilli bacterium]